MQQPRLGHINFINCLPLSYGLTHGDFGRGITVQAGTPAVLNQAIVSGELDVSPVSSIIYAQHRDKLVPLPDVSISANGALESILLVSKRPIETLKNKRIALTAKSATSHQLLKIIMHRAYQASPDYFISSLSLDAGVLDEAEAVLFIGDDALYAYHNRSRDYYYYDMGDEWKKLTGLSMVYALWVVNRRFAAEQPEQVQMLYERITGGFAYGLAHLAEAADTLIGKVPFSSKQLIHYIGLLNYQLTPAHVRALFEYYRLSQEMGLINAVPAAEFAEVRHAK